MIVHSESALKQEDVLPSVAEKNPSGTTQEVYFSPSVPPPPDVSYSNTPVPQYYNAVPQDPYNASLAYNVTPPIVVPSQSRPARGGLRTALIVGIVVAVMLTSCITIFAALSNAMNTELKMVSTPTAPAIAQVPNPYAPFKGQLVLADPLGDNSQGNKWNEVNNTSLYCQFLAGAYHLRLSAQSTYKIDWCFATNTNYRNLTFEVEMTMTKGDCAGLIFHDAGDRQLYYFCITHLGGYGLYLYYKDTVGVVRVKELAKGNSPLIYTGYNMKNLIAVSVSGSTIDLYVNHSVIQSVTDKTFLQGEIGLATHEYDSLETDVLYQNAKVWTF
jgi:hypothetical protein